VMWLKLSFHSNGQRPNWNNGWSYHLVQIDSCVRNVRPLVSKSDNVTCKDQTQLRKHGTETVWAHVTGVEMTTTTITTEEASSMEAHKKGWPGPGENVTADSVKLARPG
jgi:hypothetical protein